MRYNNIIKAKFIERPNRFIANVFVNDKFETVHVKNTGRCKELLVKNNTVYLEKSENFNRKTKYDLISVQKTPDMLINIDSQAPNLCVEEWLRKGILFSKTATITREVKYKNSRFDFYIEDGKRKAFIEVKGCTLENNGIAKFPDAPTERGVKHINELIDTVKHGYEAYILFVIQMENTIMFMPNDDTHKKFGDTLRIAKKHGVKILAYDCIVTEDSLDINNEIKVIL